MKAKVLNMKTPQPEFNDEIDDLQFCRDFVKSQNRGIVKNFDDLEVFDESVHAAEIRTLARGMSMRDICDYYGIEFEELPIEDKFFFCRMFMKGRINAANKATNSLFNSMTDPRTGHTAALAYLVQFNKNWEGAGDKNPAVNGKMPKSIKIEVIGGSDV